jgi:hypothetical protein
LTFGEKCDIIIIERKKKGDYMIQVQITYFCTTGKYKPVSAVVRVPSTYDLYKRKEHWYGRAKAIIKAQRYWSDEDMEKFGYTEVKARILPSR